jgi:hypothetical protein
MLELRNTDPAFFGAGLVLSYLKHVHSSIQAFAYPSSFSGNA